MGGSFMPVEPVLAATVILLRDGPVSPEVLMIERHSKSDFLPDLYVFPGGRLEKQDHALSDRVVGITSKEAAARLGDVPSESAQALFVAAIRETFEEAGILLASPRDRSDLLRPDEIREVASHRLEVQAGDTSFLEIIERYDLELAADRLAVHGRWITPEAVPRRFDTLFFSAVAPPGQLARHDGVETTDHVWIRPEDALDQMREKRRRIIFPTAMNLETLSGFKTSEAALAASMRRPVVAVLPRVEERDGRRHLVIPPEAEYPTPGILED
jgi:8-oxo-dGTP pyrophosphatase MutT (NUDIX family)